jgi:tetratricopeptide (TPR) repeat protein
MVNKDYILRMAEQFGRTLAIIMHLRESNKHEDALIYIDDMFLQTTGLTSSFINSVSEEMLLQTLSPLGSLNVDKCLWTAALLKAEGDVYTDTDNTNESYYRYIKSLHLFLTVQLLERSLIFYDEINDLLDKLEEYELPVKTKSMLFPYYELSGKYDQAENILFELIENDPSNNAIRNQGRAFYARLLQRGDIDLETGNLSREEVQESLAQLEQTETK